MRAQSSFSTDKGMSNIFYIRVVTHTSVTSYNKLEWEHLLLIKVYPREHLVYTERKKTKKWMALILLVFCKLFLSQKKRMSKLMLHNNVLPIAKENFLLLSEIMSHVCTRSVCFFQFIYLFVNCISIIQLSNY